FMMSFIFNIFYYPLYNGIVFLSAVVPGNDIGIAIILLTSYSYLKMLKTDEHDNKINLQIFNSIMIVAFLFLTINGVFFAITKIDYHDRYLTIAFPLFFIIFILFQTYPIIIRSIIYGTIGVCYCLMLFTEYRYQIKEYDIRTLSDYITTIEHKNEPICFYHKVLSLQFKYNYYGKNILVPLPDELKFDSSYLSKIKDTTNFKQSIEIANPMSKTYLLINDRTEQYLENDSDIKMLNHYISTHYHIILDTLFYGHSEHFPLRIRRLEKK
ncbi:MAG: hypothetical protein WCG67_08020, partial [Ferruginibacter sp.]